MSSIDQRVVQMQFENAAFQRGVAETLRSLESLNKGLQLQGSTKGLQGIGSAAASQKASLQGLENGVQQVETRFSKMQVVATTALATVAHTAVSAAGNLIKSFTLDPIMGGFREYETNMNSIQTIMANTGLEGKKGLATVNHALDELNHYSDQTIYNFSEMAKNIGTFTAAGVKLDVATSAIKGIANLAAISGSNSEQASGAMYQLSQAIAAGKVSLEDWNSVVNAGMGGKVFQDALMETARVHGVKIDDMIKKEGSFRMTLQKGWLTSKILTETLSKFTGDLSEKQLKAMGYNEDQIKGILKMGKTAQDAATKVKTMTQLVDTLKEGIGSGWAKTWQLLFGNFNEARTMFTAAGVALGGIVDKSNDSRNKILTDWKELGGRTVLIDGIKNAFQALISILKPIKDAFREIFPATTGKQLYEMTVTFRDFMERLKLGGQTMENLKRTFAGVFAIFGIGWEIVKQVVKTIFGLFGEVGKGAGGFLKVTASIGDFLVGLHKAIKEGDGLKKFFQGIGTVLAIPIKLIQKLAGFLGDLFKGSDTGNAGKQVGELTDKLSPMAKIGEMVSNAWERVTGVMDKVWNGVQKVGSKIADFFHNFGSGIGTELQNLDLSTIFAGINTGLFAGLVLMLKNFLGNFGGGGGGLFDGISDAIEGFTDTLGAMQHALNAAALLQIAIAVGILALSMNTLSKIDAEGLTRASAAISVMFGQLLGSLAVFNKFIGAAGFAKLPFVMGSLILLAGAVLILSQAVKQLAGLDWNELAKGLTGLAVTLGLLVGSLKLMPNPAGLISTGIGIIALATGVKILASAVGDMSGLGWNELAKGLVGVGAILGGLILFTKFAGANKGGLIQGAGIILLAAGIKILASAVKDLSGLSWNEIAKGLVSLAGAMAIITAALFIIPPTAPIAALGVLGVAISLGMIAKALDKMGQMSWEEIAKGLVAMLGALTIISAALWIIPPTAPIAAAGVLLVAMSLEQIAGFLERVSQFSWEEIGKSMVVLAGTLGIIALAMLAMITALPGAAATLIVAAALAILAPILMKFGEMSWEEIGKGLLMLAGVFVIFGAAAALLTPVIPMMIGLAAAVTLLGIGLLAAGAGVFLFATGLTALAAAGTAATAAIVGIVAGLIGLIPLVMKQIGLGLIAFAEVIGNAGPAILKAIRAVLNALIDAIVQLTPKIINTLFKMLSMLVDTMLKYVPHMVDSGLKLIKGVLDGIAKNIGGVVDSATKVVVAWINGVARNLPKVLDAGANLVIKFINGLANTIRSRSSELGAAGANLSTAIIEGMARGLFSGVGTVISAAKRVASSALSAAKSVLGIHSPSKEFEKVGKYVNDGFKKGLDGNKGQIDSAFKSMQSQLKALSKSAKATARERSRALSAYNYLTKSLDDEHSKLGKLATAYDKYTEKIKKADETLANAKKTRDDYNKSVSDQYSDQATPTADISVQQYTDNLKKQIEDTKVFSNALQRLRKMGLNDELYKDLIAAGPSALPFVQNLLAAGPRAVSELRKLSGDLNKAGEALGKQASVNLYQAGVNSAQGIVDGLKKQQAAIEKQMDKIAASMVNAIKKRLKIKSPSRVFAEVGGWTGKGLAQGLDASSGIIEKSAASMGTTALESLQKSLSNVADMVTSDVDTNPVITPVLDLSSIKKDAGGIDALLDPNGSRTFSPDSSYAKASYVASSYASNQAAAAEAQNGSDSPVTFNQYNNSPKALSSAEIYRQTKNQLSTAKGALST